MVADAAGNIYEGDDGGIYKLIDPNDTAGDRHWVPLVGDLSPTEVVSVAYDALNNAIITGNQDNGSSETSTTPGPWRSVGAGDGTQVQVAYIVEDGVPVQSIHFSSSQNLGSFKYRIIDDQNEVDSSTSPDLDVVGEGILGFIADSIVDRDGEKVPFFTNYVINKVDPSRMMFGTTSIFESFDLGENVYRLKTFGDNPFYNKVQSIAYGGRLNGVDLPDLAYLAVNSPTAAGNATSFLYLRKSQTNDGKDFEIVKGSPLAQIVDIVMDPADWRTVYALTVSGVFRCQIQDDGNPATMDPDPIWTQITGNLTSGTLTASDLRTIELV